MSFKNCAEHCTLLAFAAQEMENEALARRYALRHDLGQAALDAGLPRDGVVRHVTEPLKDLDKQISDMVDFFYSVEAHDCPGNPPLFENAVKHAGRAACRAAEAGVPRTLQDRIEAYYMNQHHSDSA